VATCPLSSIYFPTGVSESVLALRVPTAGPAMQAKEGPTVATIGRPRGFDVDEALDAALVVFWRQGYDGTTLTDLASAMGINRPALYAAFQGKKELFVRAIDRYYAVDAARTFQVLEEPTAWTVTEQYLATKSVASRESPTLSLHEQGKDIFPVTLQSYHRNWDGAFATIIDKILRGTAPGDIAFEQPDGLKIILNRPVASDMGLAFPSDLEIRATEIIG